MSWEDVLKTEKYEKEAVRKLTSDGWHISDVTSNDIYFIVRFLENYAEKKSTDDNYDDIMESVKELTELGDKLEMALTYTRKLLLDLGM